MVVASYLGLEIYSASKDEKALFNLYVMLKVPVERLLLLAIDSVKEPIWEVFLWLQGRGITFITCVHRSWIGVSEASFFKGTYYYLYESSNRKLESYFRFVGSQTDFLRWYLYYIWWGTSHSRREDKPTVFLTSKTRFFRRWILPSGRHLKLQLSTYHQFIMHDESSWGSQYCSVHSRKNHAERGAYLAGFRLLLRY